MISVYNVCGTILMCYAAKGGLGRLQDGSGQTANEGGVRMGNDQEIGRGGLANGSVKIQETAAEKSANTKGTTAMECDTQHLREGAGSVR